jgi:hypothetical protein
MPAVRTVRTKRASLNRLVDVLIAHTPPNELKKVRKHLRGQRERQAELEQLLRGLPLEDLREVLRYVQALKLRHEKRRVRQ